MLWLVYDTIGLQRHGGMSLALVIPEFNQQTEGEKSVRYLVAIYGHCECKCKRKCTVYRVQIQVSPVAKSRSSTLTAASSTKFGGLR